MVKEYRKGADVLLSPHFRSTEFDCRCTHPECQITLIDDLLISSLEQLREILFSECVMPQVSKLIIESGYRCKRHNSDPKVGGGNTSQHLVGKAVDIHTFPRISGVLLAEKAKKVNAFCYGGIGTGPTWTHVDVRGWSARWSYPLPKRTAKIS